MDKRIVVLATVVLIVGGVALGILFFRSSGPVATLNGDGLPVSGGGKALNVPEKVGSTSEGVQDPGKIGLTGVFETQKRPLFGITTDFYGVITQDLKPLISSAVARLTSQNVLDFLKESQGNPAGLFEAKELNSALVGNDIERVIASLTKTLTKEEVFNTLYPDYYIAGLRQVQDFLISEGVMQQESKYEFKSEQEMRAFNLVVRKYLFDKGYITKERYEAFKNAENFYDRPYEFKLREAAVAKAINEGRILVPPSAQKVSREEALKEFQELMRSQGYNDDINAILNSGKSAFFNSSAGLLSYDTPRGVILSWNLRDYIKMLKEIFTIPNANAYCYFYCGVMPVCYVEGGNPKTPGVNLAGKTCCYVVTNCSGLDTLGCINSCYDAGYQGVIWDPMTEVCGCG
ncbi:MAG: hypothetical protein Q7R91_01580 [bacterium]|nr:hypothetical protein [bacterium]